MSWNRDWTNPAKNIFEALKIKRDDRFVVIYNPEPKGKEKLAEALTLLADKTGVPSLTVPALMTEKFDIKTLEKKLLGFLEGTKKTDRKFFFTAEGKCFGPSRQAVHKLLSTDPEKFCGYTISLPTDDPNIIFELSNTSPNSLLKRGGELKKILTNATHIKITSSKGTNLDFDWDKGRRKYLVSAGFPHKHEDRWDNMGGEVYTAPIHETVNGRLVIDGAIGHIGLVDGTIAVDIKRGRGKINRNESTASKEIIDEFEKELDIFPCACVVGEFGVGTTPNLKLTGEILNDEKVEGTIHIAFGDSYSADGSGGENDCGNHTDCMITAPTVEMTINGKVVGLMKNGKFI